MPLTDKLRNMTGMVAGAIAVFGTVALLVAILVALFIIVF